MAKHPKLNVGIIGTGGIAGAHIDGYQALPDWCEIVSLCDVVQERVDEVGERLGVGARFTDYEQMLSKGPKLDVVSVCTPNNHHKGPTVAALKAGAHVLCEKPMAGNAQDGAEMVEAAKKAKRRLMIGLNNRWGAAAQAVKSFIDKGALGHIYHAKAIATRRRGIPGWGAFTVKAQSTGGPLIDIGVHILDLTMYMIGFPKPVAVTGFVYDLIGTKKAAAKLPDAWRWDNRKFDVEDYAVGLVRFEGGASLFLEAAWAMNQADEQFNFQVLGDKGGAQLSPPRVYGEQNGYLTNLEPVGYQEVATHREEIRLFLEAIRNGDKAPTPVPGEQALVVQRILDGIYESSARGCEVPL